MSKGDDFEDKLEAAGIQYGDSFEHFGVARESYKVGARWGHKEGKQEGRAEMLSEVLQAFRNMNLTQRDGYPGFGRPHALAAADWLEQRFKGEK